MTEFKTLLDDLSIASDPLKKFPKRKEDPFRSSLLVERKINHSRKSLPYSFSCAIVHCDCYAFKYHGHKLG